MLIDTLSTRPPTNESSPLKERTAPAFPESATAFDALLATRRGSGRVEDARATAMAAAELLKLDMMRSALSFDEAGAESRPPVTGRAAELVIKSFTDNVRSPDAAPQSASVPAAPVSVARPLEANDATGLEDLVNRASRRYGVEVSLIKAVIKAESNFNPSAVSRVGAQGLMQLMPATARGLGVTNAFDPEQNVMAGTRFLKDLLGRYGGNVDKALAAYNWGPGNVDRKPHLLPRETRDYLAKVKDYYAQYA
ncbi:MAG: lytic transglycosylase domain-containing protein [Desulfuromonadales bacterium]|nr:MAG: lytic transglycosylase domain-containing protein [Desulfuromonadales bacterium]